MRENDQWRRVHQKNGVSPILARPGDEVPQGTPGSGDDVCPLCSGSRRVEGQECEVRSGTGMITRLSAAPRSPTRRPPLRRYRSGNSCGTPPSHRPANGGVLRGLQNPNCIVRDPGGGGATGHPGHAGHAGGRRKSRHGPPARFCLRPHRPARRFLPAWRMSKVGTIAALSDFGADPCYGCRPML